MVGKISIVLIIVAATAWGAIQLATPKPSTSTELAKAQRICQKINDLMIKTGGTVTPSLTVDTCIQADQDCEKIEPHTVWDGTSDANGVPNCECDIGYQEASDGLGTCISQ